MHPSAHDFAGLGELNGVTEDLEIEALALGMGDAEIKRLARRYFIVELDGAKVRIELGSSKKTALAELRRIAPALLTSAEEADPEALDDVMIEIYDSQAEALDLTDEQQAEYDKIRASTMLHRGLVSNTEPFSNYVH